MPMLYLSCSEYDTAGDATTESSVPQADINDTLCNQITGTGIIPVWYLSGGGKHSTPTEPYILQLQS